MMMFFSLNMVDSKFVFSICFFWFFWVFFGFMPKIMGWWVVVAYKILVSALSKYKQYKHVTHSDKVYVT